MIRFLFLKQVFNDTGKCGSYVLIDLRHLMMTDLASQSRSQKRKKKKNKKQKNHQKDTHEKPNLAIGRATNGNFWDAEFDPHLTVGWQYENKPFLQVWKDSGSELSLVRFFMTESGAANRIMPEVELVAGFCPDKTLSELDHGSSSLPLATIALLDDRTNDGTNSISRGYLGPLDALKLYLELKKDVKLPRRGSAV